jgi:hypothetical protein
LGKIEEEEKVPRLSEEQLEGLRGQVAAQGDQVKDLKEVRGIYFETQVVWNSKP